ncbi:MAG: septum formation inhibitor Maf [Ruminococcaceae bacterium]|nr:septum formation inhibitor Maf [Oscillospiraceae bacterium]
MKKFILASASPRRKELLQQAGYTFEIIPSTCEEQVPEGLAPKDIVEGLAYQKALDVYALHPESIVLGADTIVCFDGEILGKPKDKADARRMLKLLSGQTHEVRTGFALLGKGVEFVSSEAAMVTFFHLSDEQIERYIATGEPMDKAGAYGIQGKGAVLVRSVLGDYFNVVGLPIATVGRALAAVGIHGDIL